MPSAWARRNSVQVGLPAAVRDRAAQSEAGSGSSSRWLGCRASGARPGSDAAPAGVLPGEAEDEAHGLPGRWAAGQGDRPCGNVHVLRTNSRCQRRRVDGVTRKGDPAVTRDRTTRRCEDYPVDWSGAAVGPPSAAAPEVDGAGRGSRGPWRRRPGQVDCHGRADGRGRGRRGRGETTSADRTGVI